MTRTKPETWRPGGRMSFGHEHVNDLEGEDGGELLLCHTRVDELLLGDLTILVLVHFLES